MKEAVDAGVAVAAAVTAQEGLIRNIGDPEYVVAERARGWLEPCEGGKEWQGHPGSCILQELPSADFPRQSFGLHRSFPHLAFSNEFLPALALSKGKWEWEINLQKNVDRWPPS